MEKPFILRIEFEEDTMGQGGMIEPIVKYEEYDSFKEVQTRCRQLANGDLDLTIYETL